MLCEIGTVAVPVLYDDAGTDRAWGKGSWLRRGKDMTIVATGIMVSAALEAAERLAATGIDAGVIDMHTIKPLD